MLPLVAAASVVFVVSLAVRNWGVLRPGVEVLLMSGYTGKALERERAPDSAEVLPYQPFRRAELARKIRGALDARDRSQRGG
jgi:hypothetical protein